MSKKEKKKKFYEIDPDGEDAHLIELKHQVDITFDENYDYYVKNPVKKFFCAIFYFFAVVVFHIIHFFKHGLKYKNKKAVKQLRKSNKSFITIANHCLVLDSTISATATYPRLSYFPTVEPTMKIPFIRHILRALNVIPIPFNAKGLVKFKNECNELLKTNHTLHFYPEGSLWSYYPKLRDFKPGAFRFAVDNNVPILPYCIYFRERKGLWKLLGKKPLVTIEVLEPIYPDLSLGKKPAINDLMTKSHTAMKNVIDKHPFVNHDYDHIEEKLAEHEAEQNTTAQPQ